MDTEVLRWFQQVADGQTVTEVSEIYRISQPSVSRGLARLERELGTPLLRRSGRVLRLTHAGATFKRHLDSVVHALDDGVAAVTELLDPATGTVRLSFQPSLGAWLIPDLVASFRRTHPQVTFRLVRSDGTLGSSLVAEGEVDLELTSRRPRNPEVHARRLFSEPLVLAVPPGHPFAGRPEVWLREAAPEPFVVLAPERTLREQTDDLFGEAGLDPAIAFVADDLPTVRGFVAAGQGCAVVPAMGAEPGRTASDGVTLVPLADAGARREITLLWSVRRRLLPSAEAFRLHVLADAAPTPS
ncbi:MAG: LysR family transcriptional regulator [Kineosporiaceae bacterium]|nr:LysR family transcriptional regulator [Kineosporiaceae bacterium]